MSYAGSDLSRQRLDVHVLDEEGTTVDVTAVRPDADALRTLASHVYRHGQEVTAVIESMTGARFVHDQLELRGWDVAIGDAVEVKGLAPLAAKTDKIDAWVLAELARRDLVPEIWLPTPDVRAERERVRFRLHLVRHRSALKDRIHATLLTFGHPVPVADLFGERTRVLNRLHAHLVILLPGYERTVPNLAAARHRREVARLLKRQGGVRAELARAELEGAAELGAECLALEGRIRALVRLSGSSLPTITGVAVTVLVIAAAKIMDETGDPRRFRSSPAFAAMSGTAPIPASSGQTSRHRSNRGGNRQPNRALHTIALTQSRTDPRAQAYMEKRMGEGKSWLEALRCLKRHLANVVLRTMLVDADSGSMVRA